MKKILTFTMGALALTAVTATAAGKYPFPQNMKHPHGTTIEYADTDMIKAHYQQWKGAWYNGNGWIYAPEGTESTVSEAIAYGMLITVYMDDKAVFDDLYGTWKNNGGNGGGMNWKVPGGSGSASDADFDAALALVMASVQWDNASYLSDAKAIITWLLSNDIDGNNSVKGGSNWSDAFNPSYATLANFRVFEKVSGGKWGDIATKAASDLKACQDQTSGLVPDWCDWNTHKPTKTSASVAQSEDAGFFDDAARTPWRTAWDYYWFGTASSKTFNSVVSKWAIATTHTASAVNSGYYVDGSPELSKKRNFASSTFSGGIGLATSSVDGDDAKAYLGSTYNFLSKKTSCKKAQGCGEGSNTGEKYYPSTLNMLYLLLMTGNMPNLYDLTGFEKFTPDPSKAPSISDIAGTQMALKDTTVGVWLLELGWLP